MAMACCRRAKLALNTLRNSFSLIPILKSPIQDSSSRISHNLIRSSISSVNKAKFSALSSYSCISQRLVACGKYEYNPFLNGTAKRFYNVDRYHVQHFKHRDPLRWFQNPRKALIIVLVGSGVSITVYSVCLETIPYSKRKHFILLPKETEKMLGEYEFRKLMAEFKGKILPPLHPESVRVRVIASNIVNALKKRQQRERAGSQPTTSHLEGMKWEVILVNKPLVNAFCLPGGKIVVFTGLVKDFKTDAELATIIGHEIAHAVARHSAEQITKELWFAILHLVLHQFIMPNLVNTMSALLFGLPFSRKMEIEADYIGMLLMASAGYDPRVAPKVFENMEDIAGISALKDYLSTHPSSKTRARLLAQPHVMEEAITIYREAIAGHGVEA